MVKWFKCGIEWAKQRWPSFRPSQSRWNAFVIILFISIPILLLGVTMWPLSPSCHSIMTIVFLTVGGIGVTFALSIAIYWLFKGPEDPTTEKLEQIGKRLEGIEKAVKERKDSS